MQNTIAVLYIFTTLKQTWLSFLHNFNLNRNQSFATLTKKIAICPKRWTIMKKKIQLQILKEHSDKVVTRMTSHALDHLNDPEDEKPFVVTLFVAVCRASSAFSFFFLRAQCPLKLTSSSSLSNRKPKNNL